jgi:hypothetical protein
VFAARTSIGRFPPSIGRNSSAWLWKPAEMPCACIACDALLSRSASRFQSSGPSIFPGLAITILVLPRI